MGSDAGRKNRMYRSGARIGDFRQHAKAGGGEIATPAVGWRKRSAIDFRLEAIIPGEFEYRGGDECDGRGDCRAVPFFDNDVDRKGDESGLPNHADEHIHGVSWEIAIRLDRGRELLGG